MNKVLIADKVYIEMQNIFQALIHWEKGAMEEEYAHKYIEDILSEIYLIPEKFYHANTTFASHKQFGKKVHKYRRNANTMWYIIYNIDSYKNIYINKIFSNHLTK